MLYTGWGVVEGMGSRTKTWQEEISTELQNPRPDGTRRMPAATEAELREFRAEREEALAPPEEHNNTLMWRGGQRPPWWQRQPEDYQQPYETEQEYEERRDRFPDLLVRVDRARGFPRVMRLIEILGSREPLECKKAAVEGWHWWARDFCAPRPPSLIHGRMVILWSGCSIQYLPSTRHLQGSPEWARYQQDLRARSEAKRERPYRDRREEKRIKRAVEALDKIFEELRDEQDPKKRARRITQARKRIDLLPSELAKRYRGQVE